MRDSSILYVLPEQGLWDLFRVRALLAPARFLLCPEQDAAEAAAGLPGCRVIPFPGRTLTPSREDLKALAALLPADGTTAVLVRAPSRAHGWEPYRTTLRLLGLGRVLERGGEQDLDLEPGPVPDASRPGTLLLKACGGIGNVVQTTGILSAALERGWQAVFCPLSDNGQPLAPLFADPARPGLTVVGPGGLPGVRADLSLNIECRAHIAPGDFFHSPYREPMERGEARAYARFAANVTGWDVDPAATFVGAGAEVSPEFLGRVVLVPGSKPGWDSKRWPWFGALARRLGNPLILCREPDLAAYAGLPFLEPIEAPGATFLTRASLPQAVSVLRGARAVVANDCGLAHVAAAAGAPTLVLFGPSSLDKNLHPRPNVTALRRDLPCRPCQGREQGPGRLSGQGYACDLEYACLAGITVDEAARKLDDLLG